MNQKKILPYAIAVVVIAIIALVAGKKAGWFGQEYSISVATETVESKTITELLPTGKYNLKRK
jgi:HlyD family secretion protein